VRFQDNNHSIVWAVGFAPGGRVVAAGTTSSTVLTDGVFVSGNAATPDSFVLPIDNAGAAHRGLGQARHDNERAPARWVGPWITSPIACG
jgi:hypothetical protein